MTKRFRAGVIGRTGRGNYGHGLDSVYLQTDDIEIVAVADDDVQGLEAAGKRLGVSNLYPDFHEMLEKERFDIVSICPRWVAPHLEMVQAVAAAGACVFLEKPMSQTLAQADAMIEACEQARVTIGIAHQGRMHAAVHHAKRLLREGAIGEVLSVRMRSKEDTRGGGEDMMVLGTHLFDTLRFLLDVNPTWVLSHVTTETGHPVTKTDATDGPEELGLIAGDRIHAIYGLGNGVTATFESRRNQSDASGRMGLQIFGSEGIMAVYDGSQQVRIYEAPFWRPDRTAPIRNVSEEALANLPSEQNRNSKDRQMVANEAIVREILTAKEEGRRPYNSGHDGRWAMEMIHGVYASHLQGRKVELPLASRYHPLA